MSCLPARSEREEEGSRDRIMIKLSPGTWKALSLAEVVYVKAERAESRFYTADGKSYRCGRPLHDLCSELRPHGFRRCHRTYLVNLDYVEFVVRRGSRGLEAILKVQGDVRVPVGFTNTELTRSFHWI